MNISPDFVENNAALLAKFILNTRFLSVLLLDENLRVCECNIGPGHDFTGAYFPDLLAPESKEILPLAQGMDFLNTWITFAPDKAQGLRINASIIRTHPGGYMLLGGDVRLSDTEVLDNMSMLSNELANMARDLKRKNTELQRAQAQIKTLRGIIPICMHCKEIRNDEGYWIRLEEYIAEHSDAQLSHGICDKCMKQNYPEVKSEQEHEDDS